MALLGILLRRKVWSTVAKRRIVPPKFTVRLGGIWTRNSNGRTTETSASLVLLSDHRLISNDMNMLFKLSNVCQINKTSFRALHHRLPRYFFAPDDGVLTKYSELPHPFLIIGWSG